MNILDALRFVKGSLQASGVAPEFNHYHITPGHVTGYNGHLAMSAPCDIGMEATPNAPLFFKAVEACENNVTLMYDEDTNRLLVSSDVFSMAVPCMVETGKIPSPKDYTHHVPKGFVATLKRLYPLISDDAVRPWAMGVNLGEKGVVSVTNNVIILQVYINHTFPQCNLPRFAARELIRIGQDPLYAHIDENSISFGWESGAWLKTSRLEADWPEEIVDGIFENAYSETLSHQLGATFFDVLDRLKPFVEERTAVQFNEASISVGTFEGAKAEATVGVNGKGQLFAIDMLRLLRNEVQMGINLDNWPEPCMFYGDNSRGVIIGMR